MKMKDLRTSLILVITCIMPSVSWSQYGKLYVDLSNDIFYYDSTCFQLSIFNADDTVYSVRMGDLEIPEITIDSLTPGPFFVSLTNCGEPSDELAQSITKWVEIKENEIAEVYFDVSSYVFYTELDETTSEEIILDRTELQFELSYFDFRWNPDGSNPKFNLGASYSGSYWNSFSKHVGFLVGGGVGYTFAPLQIDELTSANYPDEIKSNYYSYFYARYDMKLRFSTLNQQKVQVKAHNVFLDIGVQYNLPLYFKRVTRFNLQDKLVNSFIHRYSDARLYANLGVANFQFFVSYRPFDFVGKDLPQFPRYNTGVKFNLNF